jgi:acetylornithine deacetylase/succinyl-diaminopimelate desuccinylase-like protein
MQRREFIKLLAGSAAGAALCNVESLAQARDDRPNILLIIADDMAWDDCGAYGHRGVRTPNIDKLVSQMHSSRPVPAVRAAPALSQVATRTARTPSNCTGRYRQSSIRSWSC